MNARMDFSPKKKRTPRANPPLLQFDETIKDHGEVRAVGPVSFEVGPGQLVALIGHNGSGKSTLLATAAGILDPTEGAVRVKGDEAGSLTSRAAVSYIRDHPVLYEDLSLREHLEYLTRLHGSDPEQHDADRLIDELGLSGREDDLPSTFSRGLRQKAAIVVALCRPFDLLLVDEPFSGLDHTGRTALLRLVKEVADRNGSVVVATHDMGALDDFGRAVMLSDGDLVFDGAPTEVPLASAGDPGSDG